MFGWLKRKQNKQPSVPEEEWAIGEGNEEGMPILLRHRVSLPAVELAEFPVLINLYWRYAPGREEGMPGAADYDRMVALEKLLEPAEAQGVGFQVLSITGNSRKEWVWYAKSEDAFLSALNRLLARQERFPIEIESSHDPEWASFKALFGIPEQNDN